MSKLLAFMLIFFSYATSISVIFADTHERSEGSSEGVEPVRNKLYIEECSACHLAYPPGLLPERSWKKLLSAAELKNHFDEELEISESDTITILNYLISHSAEKSNYKRSKKIMKQVARNETPWRITETKYIKNKHRKIPQRLIVNNEDVESLSHCDACHQTATKGIFDDDSVSIPGYGRWDDD